MVKCGRISSRCLWMLGVCLYLLGCATTRPPFTPPPLPSLPKEHELRAGSSILVSDLPLSRQHTLVSQIETLPEEVCRELQLPLSQQIVQIYLFADRAKYDAYMSCQFPELPPRRAFFIARSDPRRGEELCIYTYWGDHLREDLRHELTHATLHGVLKNVPMWLDEGLAEYFEALPDLRGMNQTHAAALVAGKELTQANWPDLIALEKHTEVAQMQVADYRAAWGLVHWLLRGSSPGREVLLRYVQTLRLSAPPPPFAPLLRQRVPRYEEAIRDHLHRSCPALHHPPFFAGAL